MSDTSDTANASQASPADDLAERQFREECRKALRDEALRARELRLKLLELRANRKGKWHELLSPLGVAAIAGLVGIVGSLVTSNLNRETERQRNTAASNLERDKLVGAQQLEQQKQEAALILKLAEQGDAKQRASNLLFFADTGFLPSMAKYTSNLRGVAGLKAGETVPTPSLTTLVPTPARPAGAPKSATSAELVELFGVPGVPRDSGGCGEPSERMSKLLVVEDVGGFKIKAIKPVVETVRQILATLAKEDGELLAALKSQGSLCVRTVRGAPARYSGHAFGVAVDLSIGDKLPSMRTGTTQYGLILLAKLFEEQGFVWAREDGIHFEASAALLQKWKNEGRL